MIVSVRFFYLYTSGKTNINGLFRSVRAGFLAGKKPVFWRSGGIGRTDIIRKKPEGFFREDGITVRTVLTPGDVDAILRTVDVAAAEPAQFTDTDAG